LVGDDHVADVKRGIDATGNARKDDRGDYELVKRGLRGHRRIDHADPAQKHHNILSGELAGQEGAAIDRVFLALGEILLQRDPFWGKGRNHCDARLLVQRFCGLRQGRSQQRGHKYEVKENGTKTHRSTSSADQQSNPPTTQLVCQVLGFSLPSPHLIGLAPAARDCPSHLSLQFWNYTP
jgi:hypothetical protein